MSTKSLVSLIAGTIALLSVIAFFLGTYYEVREYERVVLTRFGKFVSVEGPGVHYKLPWLNEIQRFRTDNLEMYNDKAANTYTQDNQEVDILYRVIYAISPDKVQCIFTQVQGYKSQLASMVLDRLKREMGKINLAHVSEHRGELIDKIGSVIKKEANELLCLKIIDFQIPNMDFTDSYRKAVETAAAAKAGVETRMQEYEQAKTVAKTVEAKAKGEADATWAKNEVEIRTIREKGLAEAAAIKAQAEALAASAQLVELRKAERWNGALPQTVLGEVRQYMSVDKDGIVPRRQ